MQSETYSHLANLTMKSALRLLCLAVVFLQSNVVDASVFLPQSPRTVASPLHLWRVQQQQQSQGLSPFVAKESGFIYYCHGHSWLRLGGTGYVALSIWKKEWKTQKEAISRNPLDRPFAHSPVFVGGFSNFLNIYNLLITARILLSWFPQAQGVGALQPLYQITDPFLNLFRGVIPPLFGLDFSPIAAFFLLNVLIQGTAAVGCDLPHDELEKLRRHSSRSRRNGQNGIWQQHQQRYCRSTGSKASVSMNL